MIIGREEAFDLLRRFVAERTLLECRGSFPLLVVRLRGRLSVQSGAFRISSDDGKSEFVFRAEAAAEFTFGDMARETGSGGFGETLALIFRIGEREGMDDYLSFTEIIS